MEKQDPPNGGWTGDSEPVGPNGKPVVLVVDDEPSFCFAITEILRISGYEVHQASSVRQALALLDTIEPDLILTDIMMPDRDGLSFLRLLHSHPAWGRIPAVAVSAKALPKDREAAEQAGADAYLCKPFSAMELQETIRTFVPTSGANST